MNDDVFVHTDDWLDGYDAGIRIERSNFIGFLLTKGVLAPDRVSSALYDAQQSDMVRRSVLDYVDTISYQQTGRRR